MKAGERPREEPGMRAFKTCGRRGLALFLLASAAPVMAQEAPPPATVEGPRTFTAEDFARFAPRNALDMIRQVPGFVIRDQGQERGLGEASANVLVNGQRISGKSNDIFAELSRIPAQNVVRIEIRDGATLDIPGLSGQVANVVARATGISGQYSWSPEWRARYAPPLWSRFEASASGTEGPVEWTIGLDNQTGRGGAGGPTWIYGPDGALIEFRDEVMRSRPERPRISTRLAIDGPGSSLGNLNASFRRNFGHFFEGGRRTGGGLPDRFRSVVFEEGGHAWEIGGDYEFALGPGRLKLIGLNRSQHQPSETDLLTEFDDLSPSTGNRFTREGDLTERIARAEYKWRGLGGDLQISGEAAFNLLDNVSRFFVLQPGGLFEEIPLPGGTAQVSEDRYEVMTSYGRTLSPKLSIQLSAGGEYSTLRHASGVTSAQSFFRPKGQLTAAWKPAPRTDVNFRLRRRVGQLNFFDFLASVNLTDDRRNAGNPDLVPPQSWELEVETIRNLGPWGTTSVRLYGHLINDIVDTVPIGATGESPGNIDRAVRYGVEWKSTVNFDLAGWRGAKLDLTVQLRDSRVKDPLTGETRRISNDLMHLMEASLRHDLPGTDWAWGGGLFYYLPALNYRLTEISRYWEGPVWANLFIEHKDVLGLTVRGTINNILGGDSMAYRLVHAGRRTDPIAFLERRDRLIGPIFTLSVSGRF
jgi:outer membrane receptor for ferrienterochelin and colicins